MYLLDTNIWLERLLDQDKSTEVGKLLETIPSNELFVTDFTFHSISIILCKLRKFDIYKKFVQDVFLDGGVSLIHLEPEDMDRIIIVIEKFNLDFDDAYQYVAAEKYDLELISFDSDFDQTILGRKTPEDVLIGR